MLVLIKPTFEHSNEYLQALHIEDHFFTRTVKLSQKLSLILNQGCYWYYTNTTTVESLIRAHPICDA